MDYTVIKKGNVEANDEMRLREDRSSYFVGSSILLFLLGLWLVGTEYKTETGIVSVILGYFIGRKLAEINLWLYNKLYSSKGE